MERQAMKKYHSSSRERLQFLVQRPGFAAELADAQLCNDIAFKLYQARKSSGLTQKDLAAILGVKQSNISRWETPGYQGYKVRMLSKVFRTLGVSMQISIKTTETTTIGFNFKDFIVITNPAVLTGYPTEVPKSVVYWQKRSVNKELMLTPGVPYVR
jgi:transcriptional regulator with XRE-family HTH domain